LRAGLKQAELAKKVGVSKDMVYRWERGLNPPSRRTLEKVARVLGTTCEYLLGYQER